LDTSRLKSLTPDVLIGVSILRDRVIDQLTREIQALRDELEAFRLEVKQ